MPMNTKIIATVGPSCDSPEALERLAAIGPDLLRINFSHATHESFRSLAPLIREIGARRGRPIAILQDLQGPRIRVGELPAEGLALADGASVAFSTEPGGTGAIAILDPHLHLDV